MLTTKNKQFLITLAKLNKNIKSRLIVINQTKTLLLKKLGEPVLYSLVGGFVEEGETPREGLIREAFEEIGMKITVDELFLLSKLVKQICSIKI